ncbi:hypothetical protein SI65_01567 [Aspergillus cristatus]|uniref:Cytochrome P450 monooxygenase n=1 Tax=Aspergillus cristatus TaxID=573508 RepID=A0A1E3BSX7_ASPCR|nr:hypothetical protein SI65_01567 [Aspergillus cristatus]
MALSPVSVLAAIAVSLLLFYKGIIYPVFLSPLSKIPNAHWSAPITPAWILWKRFRSQNNQTTHAAHKRLGPIVRLAPAEISINCVDGGIKPVYTGAFEKHEWYPRVFGSFGTISMFTMTGNKDHSFRKRMLSNIYSKSFLQSSPHMRLISETMLFERFLPLIHEAAVSNTPIDMHETGQALIMDFVSAYIFGLANGTNFLKDESYRRKMLSLYFSRKPYEFYYQEIPNLVSWLRSFGVRLIPKWCDEANERLDTWCLELCDKADRSVVSTKLEEEPVVFKRLKQSITKHLPEEKYDPESHANSAKQQRFDIAAELYDQLTAGFETSAVALTYLFWELSKKPDLQKELREELLTLDPRITYPRPPASRELPSPKSIDSLPLLEAIVTETLRIHAPIPGIQPRVTPYPSCTLAGYDSIPPNTRVNAQAYSLHRNPEVFPEPETWEPKRWLNDANSSVDLEERKRWFWAFGSGGRMCIGSNLALQEMKLAVAAIYTNFSTVLIDDENIEATDAYTVKPKGDKLILRFMPL